MEKYNIFAADCGVAIPIIQRDYVQGADKNFAKRDNFLKKIISSLIDGNSLEIDFIYGSSEQVGAESYFQPVDGQQRLTTLSLFGWLLNQKVGRKYTGHFHAITYTARPSSEQFCHRLLSYALPKDYGKISTHITSVPGWFASRWNTDPTINAMLQLLDKLDELFESYSANQLELMADRFFNDSPVMFELLDMKALDLNDDLYIKMNARGKMLTAFENWKAEFEGHLRKNFKESRYKFGKIPGDDSDPYLWQYFEYAVEHEWCQLLWPIAYEVWNKQNEEDRKKSLYPRVDEYFMNIVDYVSRFIFFAALPDAEKAMKERKSETIRKLYDSDKEASRMSVYSESDSIDAEKNVELLFRIFDNLVNIQKTFGSFDDFFINIFIAQEEGIDRTSTKVNLCPADKVDLITTLCQHTQLTAVTEVMLWAVLHWTISHPESIDRKYDFTCMIDYLRIVMGWTKGIRQRLVKDLKVQANVRLSDYNVANQIIRQLSSANDLFGELAKTTTQSLEAERKKGSFYSSPKFEIIRRLSTCPELYFSFTLLFEPMEKFGDADVDKFINKFYDFIDQNDVNRIKALNRHGFNGAMTQNNHYFYGCKGNWDYVFTIDDTISRLNFESVRDAFCSYMCNEPVVKLTRDQLAYYVDRYPEFIEARQYDHEYPSRHYMIHAPQDDFTVWSVKTFSSQPIRGYNLDPYGYTVAKRYAKDSLTLLPWSDNSRHGVLFINLDENNKQAMSIECMRNGWYVNDKRRAVSKRFSDRFKIEYDSDGNEIGFSDTKNQFEFDGYVLKDLSGKDRIETALEFLNAIS